MKPEDRAKVRWRGDEMDEGLTWGTIWDGSAFVEAIRKRLSFTSLTSILEIGPGYGRLLDQILREGLPFQSYLGLDLSAARIHRLTDKYQSDNRVKFLLGDVETFHLDQHFDLCISSATLAHLYPDCGRALRNIEGHLNSGGYLMIDVGSKPEPSDGPYCCWQNDGTYGCVYAPSDIRRLSDGTRLSNLTSENIIHGQSAAGEDVVCLFVSMTVATST